LLFFIETELALRRWVAWLLGLAVRAIDRNSLSFAAAPEGVFGFSRTDFKNGLAQVIFAADLFSADP
jgi:hypothetical protein